MGFLTQTVGAVVNGVENATGNQGSGAGDWTEQQAANVENAVDGASDAVQDAASDAGDFTQVLGQRVESKLGQWLGGGIEGAGVRAPNSFDLLTLLKVSEEVGAIVASRVDSKLNRILPAPVIDVAHRAAGLAGVTVQRGPAAAWAEVKAELAGAQQGVLNKLKPLGAKLGVAAEETSPAPAMQQLARLAEEERSKLVQHLRLACLQIKADQPAGLSPRHSLPLQRSYSSGPEGVELRRLSLELLAAAEIGKVPIGPQARHHLAEAAAAAGRGVIVQSSLLMWLAAIRQLAARSRKSRRP